MSDLTYEEVEALILQEQLFNKEQEINSRLEKLQVNKQNHRDRSKTKSVEKTIISDTNENLRKSITEELNSAKQVIMNESRKDKSVRIYKLNYKAKEKELFNFFYDNNVKKIIDIRIERDKNSLKSKGIATVEFDSYDAAIKALNLSGRLFMGQELLIQADSDDLKPYLNKIKKEIIINQPSNKGNFTQNNNNDPPMKVYLNEVVNISDQEIKGLFNSFGEVINIIIEEQNKGLMINKNAVVTFKRSSQAKVAISKLNGFLYRNQYLQVTDTAKN